VLLQLLAHLERQRGDLRVVDLVGQPEILQALGAGDLVDLLVDVAGVLGRDLDLLDHGAGEVCAQFGDQCFT